jgi:anhydro-N-acetylmuramic acid kinase
MVFRIMGLMTGTSMDGVDAAILEIKNQYEFQHAHHFYLPFSPQMKELLSACRVAVNKEPPLPHPEPPSLEKGKANFENSLRAYLIHEMKLMEPARIAKLKEYRYFLRGKENTLEPITMDEVINKYVKINIKVIHQLLEKAKLKKEEIHAIASHGQTVGHSPKHGVTIQLNNGQLIANLTGIFTIADFRSRDVSLGGQGAPFAPLFHQALAIRDAGLLPTVQLYLKHNPNNSVVNAIQECGIHISDAVINIGGISNGTFINGPTDKNVKGFDTGLGNYATNQLVEFFTEGKEKMDKNAKYGLEGNINEEYSAKLLAVFKSYLDKTPPKSLDTQLDLTSLIEVIKPLAQISLADACATLEAFIARNIADQVKHINYFPERWILAGGGWNNPVIVMELLRELRKKQGLDEKISREECLKLLKEKIKTKDLFKREKSDSGEETIIDDIDCVKLLTFLKEKIDPHHEQVIINSADELPGWSNQAMEALIFAYLGYRTLHKMPTSLTETTGVSESVPGGHGYKPEGHWSNSEIEKLLENNPELLTGYQ